MATYKEIHGVKLQYRESDATAVEGDVWYNASTGKLKLYAAVGAWSSGGNLNTGRNGGRGAGSSNSAALCFGGNTGSPVTVHESYDGSSWTEIADLNTAKTNSVGLGTQTAALCAMTGTSEEWNGASWTEGSNLTTSRQEIGSAGTQTAGLALGEQNGDSGKVELYNGASWTEVGDLNTARGALEGAGISTAAIAAGGYSTAAHAQVESYDGSSWTEVGDINGARYFLGATGSQTSALAFAGTPPTGGLTESWDGSSWTEVADLSTARFTGCPAHNAPSSSTLYAGGNPSNKNVTEEWAMRAAAETVSFD